MQAKVVVKPASVSTIVALKALLESACIKKIVFIMMDGNIDWDLLKEVLKDDVTSSRFFKLKDIRVDISNFW